jgi:fructose-1,6-bisphosphatase/inositol monophosphatase family enzyme
VTRDRAHTFVEDLWPAVRQAAAIARSLEGRVPNRPKEGEASDVKAALTVADTASQEALLVPLVRHFSDVRLEAEEDTWSVRRFGDSPDARVVIDPIDGTLRSYLEGEGPYAVMAGLDLGGRYRAMVLALPREGWFLRAVEGGGAWLAEGDGTARRVRARADGDAILISYDLPEPMAARLRERGWQLREGCGGAVAVAPLLPGFAGGLRVPRPAPLSSRGRIGLLASREAGARVACVDGPAPPELDVPLPHVAVAADDAVLADLLYALEAGD